MGAKKLGEQIGISAKEAKKYIERYFANFATVKDFLQSIQNDTIKNGYVKTLIGRKRRFNFEVILSNMVKANYLRESVNTVFQGGASDLIKLAMNKIDEKYKNNDEVRMLLQIHDELIFEIKDDMISKITEELIYIMENIFELDIPLKVSVSVGDNWAELK